MYAGSDAALEAKAGGSYHWEPSQESAFFPGRQAKVVAFGKDVGFFGVVHPEVSLLFVRRLRWGEIWGHAIAVA